MSDGDNQDWDAWQREIFEGLREIDPEARFWVQFLEIDYRDAPRHELEDFPFDGLRDDVDEWLSGLDPESDATEWEWRGGGVRLKLQAKLRSPGATGWTSMPSLSHLEQPMADLHLISGERK